MYSKSQQKREPEYAAKEGPVHRIRIFNICAAIWENEREFGPKHNVTLDRSYKDGDEWKNSSTFSTADLPIAEKVVAEAFSWIIERERQKA